MKNFLGSLIFSAVSFVFSLTASGQSHSVGFDYALDSLTLSVPSTGAGCNVAIRVGLSVYDPNNTPLNMCFDLQFLVNGRLKKTINKDVRKNGAIYCVTTCQSNCGSIFGDGVCSGCKCDYSNTLTANFGPSEVKPGDVIEVRLVPARNGLRDDDPANNTTKKSYVVR